MVLKPTDLDPRLSAAQLRALERWFKAMKALYGLSKGTLLKTLKYANPDLERTAVTSTVGKEEFMVEPNGYFDRCLYVNQEHGGLKLKGTLTLQSGMEAV